MSIARRILCKTVKRYNEYRFNHVSWIKTYLYNLLWFGLSGLKTPYIYIFNDVHVVSYGKIILEGPRTKGMILLGNWKAKAHNSTRLMNYGTIIFKGPAEIQGGCILEIYGGTLEFGSYVKLAESCKVMCRKNILIHDYVSVGYETTFMDTDFHFVVNKEGIIYPNEKNVEIGKGSWVSSNCKIMKGVKLPNYSIVASNSLILKDLSNFPKGSLFAGAPAIFIKDGVRRIVNRKQEAYLLSTFRNQPELEKITTEIDDIDKFCFDNFFD